MRQLFGRWLCLRLTFRWLLLRHLYTGRRRPFKPGFVATCGAIAAIFILRA